MIIASQVSLRGPGLKRLNKGSSCSMEFDILEVSCFSVQFLAIKLSPMKFTFERDQKYFEVNDKSIQRINLHLYSDNVENRNKKLQNTIFASDIDSQ